MSTLTAIASIVSYLTFNNSDSDNGPSGADAVRTAVDEIEELRERNFTGTLGEPDIEENYGRFFKDPKVIIPVRDAPFEGVNRLVFDLPEGRDDDFAVFNELLDLFNADFDSLEDLDGETVPMTFVGGNANVLWDEIEADDEDEEEEDIPDEIVTDDDPAVNVESETISADEDGDA